jgi:hypothetical protein
MQTQALKKALGQQGVRVRIDLLFAGLAFASLVGCGYSGSAGSMHPTIVIRGIVQGGAAPVSNAKIQLYAVGTSGVGSQADPLLDEPVTSTESGAFEIPASYECPSAAAEMYVVARGGKSAPSASSENSSLALASVVGPCSSPATTVLVNEVTTIGMVWPLANYIKSAAAVGSNAGDTEFTSAAATIPQFVNLLEGTSPGSATAESYFTQTNKLYSLANLLNQCVNSTGGKAGDGSPCGTLFAMASTATSVPEDTFSAAVNIAQSPYNHVAQIYGLAETAAFFQPALEGAPLDWTLQLSHHIATPVISVATGTYSGAQYVSVSDSSFGSTIYYTTDGTTPSAASKAYAAPLSIRATTTIEAIAITGGSQSAIASSTLTIATIPSTTHTAPGTPTAAVPFATPANPSATTAVALKFIVQPSSTTAGAILSPAIQVAVEDASGRTLSTATNLVIISLFSGTGLSRITQTEPENGIATFSNLAVGTAGSYSLVASSAGLASARTNTFTIKAPSRGKTYYLSSSGNDSKNGLSLSSAWLTPHHTGLNCGDTILAAAGNYNASNFDMNHWGTVNCPSNNNVVWLECAEFAACTITDSSGHSGIRVDQSYWGIQGWSIGPLSGTGVEGQGGGIVFTPSTCTSIHHLIAANNVVSDAQTVGIGTYNNGWAGCSTPISTDYVAIVGNIVYNSAQANGGCFSGISLYQPVQTDSSPGTHIYVAGNFSYGNLDPNPCGGASPTDGEGIIFDTFDGSQGGFTTPYAAQAVVENNLLIHNGGRGITVFNNAAGTAHAKVFVVGNTIWGNNTDPNQDGPCGDLLLYAVKNTSIYNNAIVATGTGGCGTQLAYAIYGGQLDDSDQVYQNAGFSPAGKNAVVFDSPAFTLGASMSAVNPGFVSPQAPGYPSCSEAVNAVACMSQVIGNFAISNSAVNAMGYHLPSTKPVSNPLYPAWLCTVQMPNGLDNASCFPINGYVMQARATPARSGH